MYFHFTYTSLFSCLCLWWRLLSSYSIPFLYPCCFECKLRFHCLNYILKHPCTCAAPTRPSNSQGHVPYLPPPCPLFYLALICTFRSQKSLEEIHQVLFSKRPGCGRRLLSQTRGNVVSVRIEEQLEFACRHLGRFSGQNQWLMRL